MSSDDEAVGRELDAYLSALESGEERDVDDSVADDIAELREIVGDLHRLAELLGFHSGSQEAATRSAGKYVMKRRLGEGGQSTTFLAFDPELRRDVVLKRYHTQHAAVALDRVLNEARGLARLSSPFLAQCYSVEVLDGAPVLVMEYIPGTTLDVVLQNRTLNHDAIVDLIRDLAIALEEVHRHGMVHRDLKPKNIIVGDDGRPRLVDFGLVHSGPESSSAISGTPAYMSPEQARGENGRIDARTDLFGLGAILYELLAGQPPYSADTRDAILAQAQRGEINFAQPRFQQSPNWLRQLCCDALASDPGHRIRSAEEFVRRINRDRQRRHRGMIASVLVAGLLLISTGLLFSGYEFTATETHRHLGTVVDVETPIAMAEVPDSVFQSFARQQQLRQDFLVEVDLVGARRNGRGILELVEGDLLFLRIVSERNCFLTVLNYGPESPSQLYPLPPFEQIQDSYAVAHRPTTLPKLTPDKDSAVIRVTPSQGKEAICIIASTEPISLLQDASGDPLLEYRTDDDQARLRSWLRGLVRQPQTKTRALSQIVIPYRVVPSDSTATSTESMR